VKDSSEFLDTSATAQSKAGSLTVGTGTTTTQFGAKLEVADRVNVIGTGTSHVFIAKDGNEYLSISYNANNARGQITTFDSSQPLLLQQLGGNVGIGTTTTGHPLDMASGAHVTAGGVWTDASSRQYKENIANLTQEEAISALEKLNPVKFNYKVQKGEEYIGFIAEDVPDLVATGDRKSLSPMDIVAVLTKVVQQQQKKIAELEARLNDSQ